jgi:hypothetical protein
MSLHVEGLRNTNAVTRLRNTIAENAKCDRTRPHCLACIKRQSTCKYSNIANLIASSSDK